MKVILASSWHRLRQKQHMCEIRSSQSSLPCLFSMPLFLLTHQYFTPCDLISWNFCQCCQHASDSAYKTQEFPQWLSGKDSSCKFRRCRSKRSIPGSGRSPGIGNGNPLQYSCLENSTDRGALRVILHGVAESRTWLNNSAHAHTRTHMHAHMHTHTCTHTCTCIHAHTHTCTCTCTHACPRTHTHTCTYACTHARPHTHMHTYTCTHTRTHTHTHTQDTTSQATAACRYCFHSYVCDTAPTPVTSSVSSSPGLCLTPAHFLCIQHASLSCATASSLTVMVVTNRTANSWLQSTKKNSSNFSVSGSTHSPNLNFKTAETV